MTKRFSILRSATFVVGAVLTVGAFLAFLMIGNIFNPPPYQVMVVVRDVAPGEKLGDDMLATSAQRVSARVASGYVLAGELDQFRGALIIEPMHPGDPLTKNRLVKAGNPAAVRRSALGLEDPNRVLVVVPASEKNAPSGVAPGDRVDLVYSVGQPPQTLVPTPAFPFFSGTPGPSGPSSGSAAAVVATPELQVSLPLAKLVFYDLDVIRVRREQKPNPAYSGQPGESPYIDGEINAIELLVPREQQELLQWSIATGGKVAVSIVSPEAPREQRVETFGMTWDDLMAWFKSERTKRLDAVVAGESPLSAAPGAYAIVQATAAYATATVNALAYSGYAPQSTPVPPATAITRTATAAAPQPTRSSGQTAPTGEQTTTPPTPTPAASPVPTRQSPGSTAQPPAARGGTGPGSTSPSGLVTGLSFLACGGILLAIIVVGVMAFARARKKANPLVG